MAKCRKLKTPVRTKSGRMRRCKRMSRKKSKRSCSRGMKKHTRVCKRKPGRKRMSRKKSVLSKEAKELQRRCNSRANYECYGDPNCRLKVLKGKGSCKRVKCVPRSKAKKNPPTYYGPINMSMDKRMLSN